MKPLLVALLLCGIALPAHANVDAQASMSVKHRSGRTLTIMGIAHLVVGGALLIEMGVTGAQCSRTPGCLNEMGGIPEAVAGSLLVSSGALFTTIGVPMWVVGKRDERKVGISASVGGLRLSF